MSGLNSANSYGKISLMIAGAQKAGTTSLKNYLGQHPDFHTHYQKEFAFFVDNAAFATGYDAAKRKYFGNYSKQQLIAKSAGLYVNEGAVIRLKEHNPHCRIVLLLRNPIDRTYSSYLMEKNYGAIEEPIEVIEDIIEKRDPKDWRYEFFIGMSLYCKSLKMIYAHFPREQVMLVKYEDFARDEKKVCSDIFKWMNVDSTFVPDTSVRYNETRKIRSRTYSKMLFSVLKNSSRLKRAAKAIIRGPIDYKLGEAMRNLNKTEVRHEPIPANTKLKLLKFFEPYNIELSELSGSDFSGWNVLTEKNGQ